MYSMFVIQDNNDVVFEDCVIVDLRTRIKSFAYLSAGSISFVRTVVRNIDFASAFILAETETHVSVAFTDSCLAGLNRDHPYLLGQFDSRLLLANTTAIELTIKRSVFEDNFSLESGALNTADSLFISARILRLEISDSVFRRCTGGILLHLVSAEESTIVNTTFEESHSEKVPLITLASDAMTTFSFKEVKWTRNTCGTTMFEFAVSSGSLRVENCTFHENQLLGSSDAFAAFSQIDSLHLSGSVFTENGQMKQRQSWLWTDQLAPLGIFDQYKIDFSDSNYCGSMISFIRTKMPQVANVTITGRQETACKNLILGENLIAKASGLTGAFESLYTAVPLSTVFNLHWDEVPFAGYFSIADSEFAGAERFILFSSSFAAHSNVSLTVANTVFRDSQNSEADGAPVQYSGPAVTLANCSFVNCLSEIAAVSVDAPSCGECAVTVVVKGCEFSNNTSASSSADLAVSGNGVANVSISNCTFLDSKGLGQGGSISLQSVLISSALIANCTFAGATKGLHGVVYLAHTSGEVVLNYIHFQSVFSPESILLFVDTSNFNAKSQFSHSSITNSTFLAGIKLSPGARLETHSNFVHGNSGTLVRNSLGVFSASRSVLSGNKAAQGCLRFDAGAQVEISDSTFAENIVSGNVGVIYVKGPGSSILLRNCTFLRNTSTGSAGVILISGNCDIRFSHCLFEHNSAQGASILKMEQNNIPATIEFGQLLGNTALMQLVDSNLTMTDVVVVGESAEGGGIVLIRSEMYLKQSSVQEVTGVRGCLATGISDSTLVLQAASLRRVSCYKEVVALTHNSTLRIIDATIDTINSFQLSVISVTAGYLEMHNVTVTLASAIRAVVQITQTNATFSNVDYSEAEVPMVLIEEGGEILIDHCEFAYINAEKGTAGAIECSGCSSIQLLSSAFHHISASSVAGVSATAQKVIIQKCSFQHLKSTEYGALYISADEVSISDSLFDFNAAANSSSSGGALTISAPKSEISHCRFFNNSANVGGAIRWKDSSPRLTDNEFGDNQAEYGPDLASYAARLEALTDSLSALASGQTYKGQLVVHILDHAGQVIRNDNTSRAVMSSDALIGSVQSSALRGVLTFTEFVLIETPGANASATIALSGTSLNITVVLKLRECVAGEVLSEKKCVACPLDTYSFDILSGTCSTCVGHADCHNGQIYPHSGYWRASNLTEEVLRCPLRRACLGALNISATGLCSELYTGNLCQTCVHEAARSGRDRCKECLSDSIEAMRLALVVLSFAVFVSLLSVFAQRQGSHVGVMLKALLNYAHLTMLVAQFELDWPEALRLLFHIHDYLGNAIEQFLSFDCVSDALLKKVIAAAVLPVCSMLILSVTWGVINIFKKYSAELLLSAWVVSQCYCYPFVMRTSLSLFECTSIRLGEQWVRLELSIRCWDHRHSYYALAAALPALILWGIGLPALAFLYLFRHRKLVSRRSLAFLYSGFRNRYLHWELLILLRKMGIIALYVFLSNVALALQGLFLCAILWLAAALQSRYSAFESSELNDIELRGIYVGLFTTLCGLCLGVNVSTVAEYILLALIVSAHFYFIATWAIVLATKTCPKMLKKMKFIKKRATVKITQTNAAVITSVLPAQVKWRYLHKLSVQNSSP